MISLINLPMATLFKPTPFHLVWKAENAVWNHNGGIVCEGTKRLWENLAQVGIDSKGNILENIPSKYSENILYVVKSWRFSWGLELTMLEFG